jgi:hypothetical protein
VIVVVQGGKVTVKPTHRDTVLVRSVDSVQAVHVRDTLAVRQLDRGPSIDSVFSILVAVVLAAVTWYYARKSYLLSERVASDAEKYEGRRQALESARDFAEEHRENERLAAARAKLKPAAWLARRMCEQAVIDSHQRAPNQWLARWYTPRRLQLMGAAAGPSAIDILQERMRETVTLAAEAGGDDVRAADTAFRAFIAAANILNDMEARGLTGAVETGALQAEIPRARQAADFLAEAARALESLAPRGAEEPDVPTTPKFLGER